MKLIAKIDKEKESEQQKAGNVFSLVSGKKIMIDQYRQQKAQSRDRISLSIRE